jgi:hypothetical protein
MNKKTILASAVALAGLAYIPAVSASAQYDHFDYGTIGAFTTGQVDPSLADYFTGDINGLAAGTSFTYDFVFTVAANNTADVQPSVGVTERATSGDVLTSVALFAGSFTTGAATGTALASYVPSLVGHTDSAYGDTANLGPGTYTLQISGTAKGGSKGITGDVQITPAQNLPSLPVPEPEQWAMLLLGLPLISWMVRRKQAV